MTVVGLVSNAGKSTRIPAAPSSRNLEPFPEADRGKEGGREGNA